MSSLIARRAARTAILSKGATAGSTSNIFAKGNDDRRTFDYLAGITSGLTINHMKRRGPVPAKTIASNAMSFDSAGNLAYAPHNLLENANLGTRTADVPSGWAATEDGTVVWTDIGGYSQAMWSATNNRHYLRNFVTLTASETYTVFAYIVESAITAGNDKILRVINTSGTNGDISQVDWDSLGGVAGWYAVGFIMGAADTIADFSTGIGIASAATGSVTINRPGVVKGLLPGVGVNVPAKLSGPPLGRWIGTDDGDEPLYDQPRFVHDPANGNARLGLLMEEARTNLCLESSNQRTTWTGINTDVPSSDNVDIFGTSLGDEIAATSTADQQFARHQSFTGLTAAVDTTVMAHLKPGTNATFVQLAWDSNGGGSDGCFCNFNLSTGAKGSVTAMTAGTATAASINLTTEGLYRCTVTGKIASGTVGRFTINIIDRIDAVKFEAADLADNDSLIVCAADVQVGAFPLSHIPTTTASVTRAKDFCSTTDVSWHSQIDSTWFAQWMQDVLQTVTHQHVFQIDDGTTSDAENINILATTSKASFYALTTSGNDGTPSSVASVVAGTVHKLCGAYTTDDLASSLDGATVVEDNTVDFHADVFTELHIGSRHADRLLNGYIQSIKYWPVRLPNATLLAITS